MVAVLAEARGAVEVEYLSGDDKSVKTIKVTPIRGKLGVSVEPIEVPSSDRGMPTPPKYLPPKKN
jgi:hypothetical protein